MRGQIMDEWPQAAYIPQGISEWQGNPFIEALPPVRDDMEAIEAMQWLVKPTAAELGLPAIHRMHMVARLEEFMQPLEMHVDLFHRISILLRRGYVSRNPSSPKFVRELNEASVELGRFAKEMSKTGAGRVKAGVRQRIGAGSSLTLIGTSGVGKSTAVEAVLRCYDQVIRHTEIKGPLSAVYQLVWLKLSIPQDGSLKALCIDFFEAVDELLGTSYKNTYPGSHATVDNLMVLMGRVSFIHGLGLLVIDELQNLSVAKSGGAEKMMNTFKLLRDVMKVPVLSIGTPEAVTILSGDLQVARRNAGLEPMERMKLDDEFRLFCSSLFEAQFTEAPMLLDDEVVARLYWFSQGIADVVVQVFASAQRSALSSGAPAMDLAMLERAYAGTQQLLHPFLEDIRRGDAVDGRGFDGALVATKRASRSGAATNAPADVPDDGPPEPKGRPGGVPARRRRVKDQASSCLLVRVVQEGLAKQVAPHRALADAGFIRALGAEVLAG